MNPYLKRLQDQYNSLKASMEGLQTRAVSEGRDLTEDELRSVNEQSETAKGLYSQIETLVEIEGRNSKVAEMATRAVGSGEPSKDKALGIVANDRDPGHYRSEVEGGKHSFFSDLYRSRTNHDDAAARRLTEHQRALDTTNEGGGIVPPKWLSDEFETLARQGRRLANAVRNIPLGDDPRPITLPKQTAGTDSIVAEQASENTAVTGTDAWDSDVDVVTPKPTAGKQTVSRQMVDMSSPAIDLLIYGDLLDVYDDKLEAKIGAALVTASGTAVTTFASEATNWNTADAILDSVIDAAVAVRNARKRPADVLAMNVSRYGKFLKLRDSDGRPLIPNPGVGQSVNVAGVGSVAVDGIIEGLAVIATDGISSAYPESYVAFRAADTVLFESNVLRFRYEEQAGPESIVLGIWGYTAVAVRQNGKSSKRVEITAA